MQKKESVMHFFFLQLTVFLHFSSEHWHNLTLLSFHSTLILKQVINRVTALSRMELAEFPL